MAYLPSLIVSAYNHGHERRELFRVESFDSKHYSLLFLIVAKESPLQSVHEWRDDKHDLGTATT